MHEYCIIVFYSSQHAMYFENKLKYLNLNVSFMPTPRGITAGCSYSIRFDIKDLDKVIQEYDKIKFPIAGIFKVVMMYGKYKTVEKLK
ncbi:DUF3343 domain-containing protein [Caldanaerobius polysaccharolyticus]|uniref:DUF3343 domain-containing protein n=1 Tax=Caldanaerobius polysaccharolyticus TaxID=44256 RepID=UPI00047AFA1A|nr:DUF3343 domain-containing protein [Caldanaerobius polysaccharolyticus]